MSQPAWKELCSTDYSRLLLDTTGVYPPELEVAQEISEDEENMRYELYRIPLERYELRESRLTDGYGHRPWFENDFHKIAHGIHTDDRYCEPCGQWISRNLSGAASSADMDPDELRELFCSDDPIKLAQAYETVAGCHGYENFDSYPIELSRKELDERWK